MVVHREIERVAGAGLVCQEDLVKARLRDGLGFYPLAMMDGRRRWMVTVKVSNRRSKAPAEVTQMAIVYHHQYDCECNSTGTNPSGPLRPGV